MSAVPDDVEAAACSCRPGSYANGWHEIRCRACELAEMATWQQAIDRWRARRDEVLEVSR